MYIANSRVTTKKVCILPPNDHHFILIRLSIHTKTRETNGITQNVQIKPEKAEKDKKKKPPNNNE